MYKNAKPIVVLWTLNDATVGLTDEWNMSWRSNSIICQDDDSKLEICIMIIVLARFQANVHCIKIIINKILVLKSRINGEYPVRCT